MFLMASMAKITARTKRADGRGHWPAGKRRGDGPIPRRLRARMERAIEGGQISIRGIARHLGVSDRTVRRWLTGEHWPVSHHLDRLSDLFGGGR